MQYSDALPRARKTGRIDQGAAQQKPTHRRGDRVTALVAAAALLAPGIALIADPAPASAVEVSIPVEGDTQARMAAHVGWDADVAAAPNVGDCVRYGSADGTVTAEMDLLTFVPVTHRFRLAPPKE